MNASAKAILTNPDPCGHIVYPYTSETQLVEAVGLFAGAGLRKHEVVLLILKGAHRDSIRQRLASEGFGVPVLEASRQLMFVDAENLLNTFMVDGKLDESRFKSSVGEMISAAKNGLGRSRQVRVFGEMVDLIWEAYPKTTLRLEELWNEVIEAHFVPLLCAYSLAGPKSYAFPQKLLFCHSQVV